MIIMFMLNNGYMRALVFLKSYKKTLSNIEGWPNKVLNPWNAY